MTLLEQNATNYYRNAVKPFSQTRSACFFAEIRQEKRAAFAGVKARRRFFTFQPAEATGDARGGRLLSTAQSLGGINENGRIGYFFSSRVVDCNRDERRSKNERMNE